MQVTERFGRLAHQAGEGFGLRSEVLLRTHRIGPKCGLSEKPLAQQPVASTRS